LNVEYVNPFIEASQSIIKTMAGIDAKLGKVFLKDSPYSSDSIAIIIGVTGKMRGQVIMAMNIKTACEIASSMMGGMPISELDEISKSAISELSNMILGNTATILANRGIEIEITPPSMVLGENIQITNKMKTVCIPLSLGEKGVMELDVSIADEN
jgi:chemotaxis protein CheX